MRRVIRFACLVGACLGAGSATAAETVEAMVGACRAALRTSPVSGPVRGLVYYQDFDHQGRCLMNEGWAYDQGMDPARLDRGRFGKGWRSERPRQNFLSPNQASVEAGTDGFTPGEKVRLSCIKAPTRFGRTVLRADAQATGTLVTLAPVTVKTKAHYRKTKCFCLSVYVRSDKPGAKVRLTLVDTAKPGKGTFIATKTIPSERVLSATWQRASARIEMDVKRAEQCLVGALELVEGAPATVLVDGLQLEQYSRYPETNTDPTGWIPGGTKRAAAYLSLPVHLIDFTGKTGTLGCWVKNLPTECGGTRAPSAYVSIGSRWHQPVWQLGGWRWLAGDPGKSKYKRSFLWNRGVGKRVAPRGSWDGWHLVVLTWGGKRLARYIDGELFGQADTHDPAEVIPSTSLRIGGSHLENWTSESLLDDVFLYNRCLSADEVRALARRTTPLAAEVSPVLLRYTRTRFLRSEDDARIALEPVAYGAGPAKVRVTASVPTLGAAADGVAEPGDPLVVPFTPWRVDPSTHELLVTVTTPGRTTAFRAPVRIYRQPPSRDYIINTWGGVTPDTVKLGFTATTGGMQALAHGLWAEARLYKPAWDVLDPVVGAECQRAAQNVARSARTFPNMVACQVNTEVGMGGTFRTDAKYLAWMKKEIGLDHVPEGAAVVPLRVVGRTDMPPDGLVTPAYAPYRFCTWWQERGCGIWLMNNRMVHEARRAGLDTTYYTDCPYLHRKTQFEAMDMVDHWAYPETLCGLVAAISRASAAARLRGVPLRFTPGTIFWDDGSGLWLKDTDGKRKVLCYGPDHLKEMFWLTVASATTRMGLYGLIHRQRDIWDPAGDAAMRDALHAIRPVGVLVGGLPARQAPVAVLDHDGLVFMRPEGKHQKDYGRWRRHWIMRIATRVTARTRLGLDWIGDIHVRAGWLDRYKVVVVPSAWCLAKDVHAALVRFASQGGKVLVDKVMRATIPGAVVLDIDRQLPPRADVEKHLGGWLRRYRDAHPGWATVTPTEQVYTTVREADGVRYLFVVNDHREPGPQYKRFKVTFNVGGRTEPLRDRGLPLEAKITLPAGGVVYDVLAHAPVATTRVGARRQFTTRLAPGWAGVYAVLPRPIATVTATGAKATPPGSLMPIRIDVLDDRGKPAPGRQMVEVSVTSPKGPWQGVARYHRVKAGRLVLPLRLSLSAPKGTWQVRVLEWVSGKRAAHAFTVN